MLKHPTELATFPDTDQMGFNFMAVVREYDQPHPIGAAIAVKKVVGLAFRQTMKTLRRD